MEYEIELKLNGDYWKHPVLKALSAPKTNEVNKADAMKQYFQLEASKATLKYGF